MSLNQSDLDRWERLGKWGRFKKRNLYQGRNYSWAYKNVTPEEYPYWVLSNCDVYILSGGGSLFPDIMLTPIEEREWVSEARERGLEQILARLRDKREQRKE